MAMINLDVEKITSISNELDSLNTTLINNYTPELKDNLISISSNVRNTQINSILTNISSQIDTITGELSQQLPRLQEFLVSQMQSYTSTEQQAEADLNTVLQKMNTFSGNTAAFAAGSTAGQVGTTLDSSSNSEYSASSSTGTGLGGKVASGAVSGAVLGGIAGATGIGAAAMFGTSLGTVLGGPLGTVVGAGIGAAVGAVTPVVCNVAAKGVSVLGKGLTAAGDFLDGIF